MTQVPQVTRACWQPWESLNIAADGYVYPCCVVHPDLQIGDVNSQTLQNIIEGAPAVELKRRLLIGDINSLPCLNCPNAPLTPPEDFQLAIRARYLEAKREPATTLVGGFVSPPANPAIAPVKPSSVGWPLP